MKLRLLSGLLVVGILLFAAAAYAQSVSYALVVSSCAGQSYNIGQNFPLTQLANGTPCQGTVTATTAATAQSALPSLSAGAGNSIYENLFGGLYTQPTFNGQAVDGTHGLPVNCIVGCAGGTLSNATSAVATSSTNGGANSWLYGFNGTTWDQLQVDGSKFLKVNCATGCAAGTVSNASSAVATSSTNSGSMAWNYGFNGTTWDQLQVDGSKFLKVNISAATQLPAALDGSGFLKVHEQGTATVSGTVAATPAAATTGGCTPVTYIAAASTNATSVVTGARTVYSISVNGTNASTQEFVKVYDKASAPTVGTDTPVGVFGVPGQTGGSGNNPQLGATGMALTTGLAFAMVQGIANSSTTAVAASDLSVTICYK